jgi:hypothetical protein
MDGDSFLLPWVDKQARTREGGVVQQLGAVGRWFLCILHMPGNSAGCGLKKKRTMQCIIAEHDSVPCRIMYSGPWLAREISTSRMNGNDTFIPG